MENSDDEYERPHVIIDNGSSYMKCGLSGEEGPRAVIRSCVGYPKKNIMVLGVAIFISVKILSLKKDF